MGLLKIAVEGGRKRLSCPECRSETFRIEYGSVKRPIKGGRKMRYIARCEHGHEHHISYGHSN